MTPFFPIRRLDGYLPLEDYGLIGDGTTAALVGRDGAISWLCVPRFDSAPLFCNILDTARGGTFSIAPEHLVESRQFYEPDSGVLVTEMRSPSGLIRLTDALLFHTGADLTEDTPAGRGELLRLVQVLQGQVRVHIVVEPRGGTRAEPRSEGLHLCCALIPELDLQLSSSVPLRGLRTSCDLREGDTSPSAHHAGRSAADNPRGLGPLEPPLRLRWAAGATRAPRRSDPETARSF
jgi:hypothetical protein